MTVAEPRVSVCVQAYQHAAFIEECLESILAQQTDFPFEIILGDDDSTDGTREICRAYAEKHPGLIRLFLRSERDRIYINGVKTGRFNFIENMRAARGLYICLLDGDDYWISRGKLQTQFSLMESDPACALSFHKTLQRVGDSAPALKIPPVAQSDRQFTIAELMGYVDVFSVHTSNCMFRRKALEEMPRWFYEVPFLDVPLFAYVGAGGTVRYINEPMSVYRIHRRGMWLSVKEPANFIRQWKMFSILARETEGELQAVMLERRERLGRQLIGFYRKHLWEDRRWLEAELRDAAYPGDGALLELLQQRPALSDYLFNLASFSKKAYSTLLKR